MSAIEILNNSNKYVIVLTFVSNAQAIFVRTYPSLLPEGADMVNRTNVNSVTIETDKSGMGVVGNVIVFHGGSAYNTSTGAFNNAGPDYVNVNRKTLSNSDY